MPLAVILFPSTLARPSSSPHSCKHRCLSCAPSDKHFAASTTRRFTWENGCLSSFIKPFSCCARPWWLFWAPALLPRSSASPSLPGVTGKNMTTRAFRSSKWPASFSQLPVPYSLALPRQLPRLFWTAPTTALCWAKSSSETFWLSRLSLRSIALPSIPLWKPRSWSKRPRSLSAKQQQQCRAAPLSRHATQPWPTRPRLSATTTITPMQKPLRKRCNVASNKLPSEPWPKNVFNKLPPNATTKRTTTIAPKPWHKSPSAVQNKPPSAPWPRSVFNKLLPTPKSSAASAPWPRPVLPK
mmetsp:Transcript_16247/g.35641  ORF Transcript_16247/g.35641 Transcript_16247/m.35641 type:complete len:298 (+) Transcript_16247:196-1089(+)